MNSKTLNPVDLKMTEDWEGNNAAFTCPSCSKVFLVSGMIHKKGRACPACGLAIAYVEGGRKSGGSARIEWATSE
ncbi:hypothetical protein SAMN02745157_1613 [Kaistia soli DSM 19436]|uniref:Uncharacterized protein n=1 Tax=Kaistia soli DSM 19436 TaxID=1122133 RepID=A0A1M4YU21_9HYPH|nr:hypothetical protein SAMN02745157_1613 [Kaistia soli DSM 19436]